MGDLRLERQKRVWGVVTGQLDLVIRGLRGV